MPGCTQRCLQTSKGHVSAAAVSIEQLKRPQGCRGDSPGSARSMRFRTAPMLRLLQQLSPMPCQITTGSVRLRASAVHAQTTRQSTAAASGRFQNIVTQQSACPCGAATESACCQQACWLALETPKYPYFTLLGQHLRGTLQVARAQLKKRQFGALHWHFFSVTKH